MQKQAAIVRVHRPELTARERAKRMEEINKAAAHLIAASLTNQRKQAKA